MGLSIGIWQGRGLTFRSYITTYTVVMHISYAVARRWTSSFE